jgi:putative ABC transport system permease protein
MIKNYFKIAWRNLHKNKIFSSINLIGLALSMACCLAISLFVWNETHFDTFHQHVNDIYRITNIQNQAGKLYFTATTPGPLAPALQKDFPEIKNTVRFGNWSGLLKYRGKVHEEKNVQLTENSIFSIFNFPLLKGNAKTALLSPDEMVITENAAIKYFGTDWRNNPSLLGEVFTLNNETSFKLVGVLANPPENSSIQFDILLPMAFLFKTDEWSNNWNSNNYHTYVRLKFGTNLPAFEKKLAQQLKVYKPETENHLQLQSLKDQYLYSKFDFFTDWGKRSDIRYVKIFSAVGLFLLLIACVNFVNLSTAQYVKRSVEVSVRKVNGASRRQLIFQFLSESVLMAVLGGIAAIFILKAAEPFLGYVTGSSLYFHFFSATFLLFFLGFIIFIGLVAGIYPAFFLSAFNPIKTLKGNMGMKSGGHFRKGLVIFQFTIAITMIICTSFMYRQLKFIQSKNLGFNSEQIICIRLANALKEKAALLKQDLENQSAIAATASATMSLANDDNSTNLEWQGMKPSEEFLITQANIDPDFIPALNIELVKGENFKIQNVKDTINNFIVNETAVRMMGNTVDNVIDKKVKFYGAPGRIIGVVKDFHFKPLSAGIEPFIFRYQPWSAYFHLFVKTVPGKTEEAINQIQKYYKKYDTETPLEFTFLNESIDQLYTKDKQTSSVILLFACLTIFIGCLGLFGLTVFAAEQRIKEIGIRKVLGATVATLVGLLSKDFLKLIFLSTLIAIPVAWYFSHQWLQNFAYRIHIEWWVFVLASLAVILIALLTVSFQAIKAAIANPVKSLRTE